MTVDEYTYSAPVEVYSKDELDRFRDLEADFLAAKRRLSFNASDEVALKDGSRAINEVIFTFGPDVWFLVEEEATGSQFAKMIAYAKRYR